jgi:thiosulfate reductase cytochrome b subunit
MDKEKQMEKFWTMQRRAWAYSVMVALVPLLVAIGLLTGDLAQLVLNVCAAVLAVGGGSMALSNLTPDNVFKMGVQIDRPEE